MTKIYKVIEKDNEKVTIYGSNRGIRLEHDLKNDRVTFRFKNNVYDLDEFMTTPKGSFLEEFDGYMNDTFFSGVAIKLIDGETIKAFTFTS